MIEVGIQVKMVTGIKAPLRHSLVYIPLLADEDVSLVA